MFIILACEGISLTFVCALVHHIAKAPVLHRCGDEALSYRPKSIPYVQVYLMTHVEAVMSPL
jgi:hypothetical protein